ncbi:TetR family transcriptional regulator [Mycobacterium sp. SP-6446]|uniref:TetR family transcriptional regulator n=1 Tax=Mycobacterium sp. SP-6446 TaxID=1834162 RepID=UPI00096F1D1E|nr:TetR family transcriptional regulator [Mycobacterium sp. SP-6446]OMC08013.1 TetR family transcriptional regulator [Mycobacterium sp. SP-6446]
MRDSEASPAASEVASDPLIDIVVDLIDTQGYDAVQLREVARRARMSLTTIYKRYPTRDELIVAALRWWMDTHRYAALTSDRSPSAEESIYDGLMWIFREIFEPWEKHPNMLQAYVRAKAGPGGAALTQHGFDVVVPAALAVLSNCDDRFAEDVGVILTGIVYGTLGQFASGAIAITDIVPTIERTVYWLTKAHENVYGDR